jgi:uncharacterized protein with HEPN domain
VNAGDRDVLLSLLRALQRAERKSKPLIKNPEQLEQETGEDAIDVICMQFLAAGEALKRLDRLKPGFLQNHYPEVDWKGAMGFRDIIAHQYFDLDTEQIILICQDSLPAMISAIEDLLQKI